MSAGAILGGSDRERAIRLAALLATFMQATNIALPNAVLLHIQGTLSMSDDEVGWVFSSYIAASNVVLPMTGWLAHRFGRRTVFQTSLAIFVVGLLLDTQATTPLQFVLARIVQGAASGTLAPLALAILLDHTVPEGHPRVSLIWTVTILLGILSGPATGGWIGEHFGWPSIFHASLPIVGFVALVFGLCLTEKTADIIPSFDFYGLAAFSIGVIGLQLLLDRGERLEWFASKEIWIEAIASALGFYVYLVHVLTAERHFLHKALFRDRNFVLSTIMFFAFGFVFLPTLALTSPMLDEIFGYPADTTGYVTVPRGLAFLAALILTWRERDEIDNRLMVAGGFALAIYANWRMLAYSPLMDWRPVALAGAIQGAGLGILMPALTRAAFSTLAPASRPEGVVLFNLSRLYGSSIGIAVVQAFVHVNTQSMHLALAGNVLPYGAVAQATGPLAGRSLALVDGLVTGQAAVIAIIGQFKLLMIVMIVVSPLTLLLRRPRPDADIFGAAK